MPLNSVSRDKMFHDSWGNLAALFMGFLGSEFPHGVSDPSYNHTCNHSYNHIIILQNDYMRGSLTPRGNSFPGFLRPPRHFESREGPGAEFATCVTHVLPLISLITCHAS